MAVVSVSCETLHAPAGKAMVGAASTRHLSGYGCGRLYTALSGCHRYGICTPDRVLLREE